MHRYVDGAVIANQVASYVANLEYSATANHLSRYDCLLVPLAVDAGMERWADRLPDDEGVRPPAEALRRDHRPSAGARRARRHGVEDFCRIRRKCAGLAARRGPSRRGIPKEVNGSLRWKLNEMTCFEYWGKVGTDCNVCMRVCPWSHARTIPASDDRLDGGQEREGQAIVLSATDDIFYGKRPRPKDPPAWAGYRR